MEWRARVLAAPFRSVAARWWSGAVGANGSQGAAYVFTQSGSTWIQTAKLTASDGAAYASFGSSVSISGNVIVVGADGANSYQGAAYVFTESGSTWTQTAKLTASDGAAGDFFGNSVSVSGDTVVVGAENATVGGNDQEGAAYVFTESGSTWTPAAKLVESGGASADTFGSSVSISGNTIVVGAPSAMVGTTNYYQGAAYVFTGSGSTWAPADELSAADGKSGDLFGLSVSISGNMIVVGADQATVGTNGYQGAAYVFTGSGSAWSPTATLTAPDGAADDHFGDSVSISGDAVVIGAPGAAVGGNSFQGAAYEFTESGSGWSPTATLTAPDGEAYDGFGDSVSISGNAIAVGSPDATVVGRRFQGLVYVGPWPLPSVTGLSPASGSAAGGTAVTITGTDFTGATAVDFGSTAATATSVQINSAGTQITATSPAGAGTVNVMVVTPEGTSDITTADEYTYLAVPAVTGLSVSDGPLAGGTTVTIAGTNLSGITAVDFGSMPAALSNLAYNSNGTITITSPATESAGIVDVTVTTAESTSATSSADRFTYTPLAITSLDSATFTVGTAGTFSLATGYPTPTFTLTSGFLPNGVTLSPQGMLSGTPAAGTVGLYPIIITASSSNGAYASGTQVLNLMVATSGGALYWLTSAASGGWLEMRAAGQNFTQVIDTNVRKFQVDSSGSVAALEDSGNLVRFAPDSTVREVMYAASNTGTSASAVVNFVMDGSGAVFALVTGGGLLRFAAGAYTPTTISGDFSTLAAGGSGSVVALDTGNNLWFLASGSSALSSMAGNVQAFVVDGGGSVVAFERRREPRPARSSASHPARPCRRQPPGSMRRRARKSQTLSRTLRKTGRATFGRSITAVPKISGFSPQRDGRTNGGAGRGDLPGGCGRIRGGLRGFAKCRFGHTPTLRGRFRDAAIHGDRRYGDLQTGRTGRLGIRGGPGHQRQSGSLPARFDDTAADGLRSCGIRRRRRRVRSGAGGDRFASVLSRLGPGSGFWLRGRQQPRRAWDGGGSGPLFLGNSKPVPLCSRFRSSTASGRDFRELVCP